MLGGQRQITQRPAKYLLSLDLTKILQGITKHTLGKSDLIVLFHGEAGIVDDLNLVIGKASLYLVGKGE